jgi:hypothetical protein
MDNKRTECKFVHTDEIIVMNIMPPMADEQPPAPALTLAPVSQRSAQNDDPMICERCGKAEMYRMHAVWRCPECGYKTDCCGW